MNTNILTKELLLKVHACKKAIDLCERNNLIEEIDSYGDKYTYKYDKNNNMIEEVYPDGKKYLYKYDKNNNMKMMNYY